MKVGIIEICEPNHYSAVNGLMKSYASDPSNEVYVFTLPKIGKALEENGLLPNIKLIVWNQEGTMVDFLQKEVAQVELDRVHYCTIRDNVNEFYAFDPKADEIYFHVHNIDLWFNDTIGRLWSIMTFDLKNKTANRKYYNIVGRFFLEALKNRPLRKKFLKKLWSRNYHYIVHSAGQRDFIAKFTPSEKITVFPFAIYEGMEDRSGENTSLRVCIPGVISSERRDYAPLFDTLIKNAAQLKGKILIDLLGSIAKFEKAVMEKHIQQVKDAGVDIQYATSFIPGEEYDIMLSKSDIILGNLIVQKGPTQKYGVTKETGVVFNMLRGSKPGILPIEYQTSEDFKPSSIFFNDYTHLGEILLALVNDPEKIKDLRQKAVELSHKYSAPVLYQRLKKN